MSRQELAVNAYMTPSPTTVPHTATLEHAQDVLRKLGVRHLPVLNGTELLGVLSDRDVKGAMAHRNVDPRKVEVGDVCSKDAYVTHPGALLRYVAQEMADKRYGSTVVMDGGKVVGIVTTTDVARALADLL
jgi:acetoin utilization protein AcuB